MTDIFAIANTFMRQRSQVVEQMLVKRIEEVLGRVPSNEEVARRGRCIVARHVDREDYYWNDTFLFGIETHIPNFTIYDKPGIYVQHS